MTFRVRDTPWGGARFAFAYLAGLAAALIASFVSVIGGAVAGSLPCAADPNSYCVVALTGLTALAGLAAGAFWMAFVLRLTWQYAAWFIAAVLAVAELVVETNQLWLALFVLAVPAVAAAMSFERPDREVPRPWRIARLAALGLVVAQFVAWLLVLMLTPS